MRYTLTMQIRTITTTDEAKQVISFLLKQFIPNNLDDGEKADIKRDVTESLAADNNTYIMAEDQGDVIGAIGVHENYVGNGGHEIGWLAVDKSARRTGVGTKLLKAAEEFIRNNKGRYLIIDTGSTKLFDSARAFYEM